MNVEWKAQTIALVVIAIFAGFVLVWGTALVAGTVEWALYKRKTRIARRSRPNSRSELPLQQQGRFRNMQRQEPPQEVMASPARTTPEPTVEAPNPWAPTSMKKLQMIGRAEKWRFPLCVSVLPEIVAHAKVSEGNVVRCGLRHLAQDAYIDERNFIGQAYLDKLKSDDDGHTTTGETDGETKKRY